MDEAVIDGQLLSSDGSHGFTGQVQVVIAGTYITTD